METFNSWKGRLVKGRDLKSLGLTWVKVTNEKMKHYDVQYKIGENEDIHELTTNNCSRGGLYFCPLNVFGKWIQLGNGYHEVSFTDDEDIWIEEYKCKAKRIILDEKVLFVDMFVNMDIENCKIVTSQNVCSIQYMSEERKNDPEICKIAVAKDGRSIKYMSNERRNDPEICKIAAAQDGYSIQFMSVERRNDSEICKIAAAQDGCSMQFMSKERRNDPEICKIAAAQNWYSIRFMSEERENDPEICKIAGVPCSAPSMRYNYQNNSELRIFPAAQNTRLFIPFGYPRYYPSYLPGYYHGVYPFY
jgi:hypothetical protein